MFLPMGNVELWDGVRVTESQSLPPMMGVEGNWLRISALPPAWSQWWWVLMMAVRLMAPEEMWSLRVGTTSGGLAGSMMTASLVASSVTR
jgi:hypothetical protein